MTNLRFLFLENNQVVDLGVLVDMAKKDAMGEKRFAPYLKVYLSGNPLSEGARTGEVTELRGTGATVFLGERTKP
jgi:hypothetical protein